KYRTGKLTPDGKPDPSVFSTEHNREGIQVGTAISLLVRTLNHQSPAVVRFRNLWGQTKRADLLDSLKNFSAQLYGKLVPERTLGLPFRPLGTSEGYLTWPLLSELFPVWFAGVKTSRDDVVVDIDRDRLVERMMKYFDPKISHEEMRQVSPGAMSDTATYQAAQTRE